MADDDDVVNPGMVIVTLVPNDSATNTSCPDCHRRFKAGDEVFISIDEKVLLHVTCVVALALVASVRNFIPADAQSVYEHLRETLIRTNADG
jgi:hypothetical protein